MNTEAKEAARILGSIKTKKKAKASRRNGLKGGRPRKLDKKEWIISNSKISPTTIDLS